jgi:hypothetical protein
MLSLIKDFGKNYDQVLLQNETVLYGKSNDSGSQSTASKSIGSDDD